MEIRTAEQAFPHWLGPSCVGTWFLTASDAASLDLDPVAVLDEATGAMADLRALKGATDGRPLVVDVSAFGPYLCPVCLRGADVVVDDLSTFGCAVDAVGVSLSGLGRALLGESIAPLALPDLFSDQLMPEGPEGYARRAVRMSDAAAVLTRYLLAFPKVAEVRYPGLKEDPSFRVAERTLVHGYGPHLVVRLRRPLARDLDLHLLAPSAMTVDAERLTLRVTCGDEDPLGLVEKMESILAEV